MEGGETLGSPTSPRTISELRALLPSDSELATTSGAPSRAPSHSFGHPHRVPSPPQILSPTGAADKPTAYGYYDQSDQPPTTSQTLAQTVLNPSRKILSEAPRVELPSSSSGHQVKHPRSSSYSRHRRSTKAQHPPTVPESITELRDLLEENSVYANTEELRPEPIHVPPFAPGVSSSLQSGARSFLSDRSPMTSPSTVLPSSFSQRPQRSRGYTPSPIKTSPGRSPASPISPTGLLHHNPILTSPMTTSGAWIPHAPSQTSSLPQKATAQNLLCSKQIEGAVVRAPSPGTNNGGSEYSVTKELISNIKRKGIEGYEITPQERYDEQIKLKLLAAQNTNRYVAELVSPSQLQEPDIPASRLDEVDPNLEPVEAGGVRYLDIFSQWNRPLSEMSEGTRIKYSFEQQAIVLNARHQEAVKAIYLDQTLNEEEKRRLVADREQEFERNIKRIQEVTGYKDLDDDGVVQEVRKMPHLAPDQLDQMEYQAGNQFRQLAEQLGIPSLVGAPSTPRGVPSPVKKRPKWRKALRMFFGLILALPPRDAQGNGFHAEEQANAPASAELPDTRGATLISLENEKPSATMLRKPHSTKSLQIHSPAPPLEGVDQAGQQRSREQSMPLKRSAWTTGIIRLKARIEEVEGRFAR